MKRKFRKDTVNPVRFKILKHFSLKDTVNPVRYTNLPDRVDRVNPKSDRVCTFV